MDSVSLIACLDADPRPTCVLDLLSREIAHENVAIHAQNHLLDDIRDHTTDKGLQTWIWSHGNTTLNNRPLVNGHTIYTYTVQERWQVVQWLDSAEYKSTQYRSSDSAQIYHDGVTGRPQRLFEVMELSDVGVFEYDTRGKLAYGNDAFYKLTGQARNTSMGDSTWQDSVFSEDHEWFRAQWDQLMQGNSLTFEMKWKRSSVTMPDGKDDVMGQQVSAVCVPVIDGQGNVTSVSGCITDIAARNSRDSVSIKNSNGWGRVGTSERRFRDFAENTNIGIWIVNLDMQVQFANREWFALSGHPPAPFKDVNWSTMIFDDANMAVIMTNWNKMIETKEPVKVRWLHFSSFSIAQLLASNLRNVTGDPVDCQKGTALTMHQFQFDLKRTWSDGQGNEMQVWVLCCCYPELDDNGTISAVAGTIADITHLRWAEMLQKQRTDDAIEAKRQQENFIDMTCHEIRNPLGAVVHCADIVRASLEELRQTIDTLALSSQTTLNPICDSAFEANQIVFACCAHQKRIVDDILTLSKLDSKLVTIAPEPVRLDDLLLELSRMFEADAQKADVTIQTIKDQSLELITTQWAMLDRGRLMQVLINLITNSLKFTQKESERLITLSVGASRTRLAEQDLSVEFTPGSTAQDTKSSDGEDVFIYFKVSDTGCGFDAQEKGRIFKRFSQASPRTHSQYGGSGLGLFISREMVELHGGKIGVHSRPGQGATFAFYVSCTVTDPPRVAVATVNHRPSPEKKLKRTPDVYTILVVEDNLINQKVLHMRLEKAGHSVYISNNGKEALEFLEKSSCWSGSDPMNRIDLSVVLMDLEMPIMGGLECARRIRELQQQGTITKHLPIIAVSANARDAHIAQALECGMDDTISKPFQVSDLMPKIEKLIVK